MQRRYYYIISGISILILSYLFYQACKRDTSVSDNIHAIGIPDSSWLAASIDLNGIRNEIAWNTLLNGNFSILFNADSIDNTLFQVLKSPSDFDISEGLPIYYFSKWEDTIPYHGIIISLHHSEKLHAFIGGNMIASTTAQTYISRTKEGVWIYDEQNLLFLFQAKDDSITGLSYFHQPSLPSYPFKPSDSITVSIHLDTKYIPSQQCSPLLDSIQLSLQFLTKGNHLYGYWSYQGIFDDYAENTVLKEATTDDGLYYAAKHTPEAFQTLNNTFPAVDSFYQKNKELLNHVRQATDHNTVQVVFNGWQQVKNSYYVSEMNDEFEVVLKKKDTSFKEPVFRIQLDQTNVKNQGSFISYLQKQGLIALQKKKSYSIIMGNFDSELVALQDNSIIVQNKHTQHPDLARTSIHAAFLLTIHPEAIKSSDVLKTMLPSTLQLSDWISRTEQIRIIGNHSQAGMNGLLNITFKEAQHPYIQIIQLLSKHVSESNVQIDK